MSDGIKTDNTQNFSANVLKKNALKQKAQKDQGAQPLTVVDDGSFLPDFCRGQGLMAILVISQLLALLITLSSSGLEFFDWLSFSKVSLISVWVALLSAILLCFLKPAFAGISHRVAALAAFLIVLLLTLVCGAIAEWVSWWYGGSAMGLAKGFNVWKVLEYLLLAAIPTGILLSYLYLQQQLRIHNRAELEARIQALQSRIRPHFLFNSMNTVASLIGSDPEKAEQVVEDMSDLFRYALSDTQTLVPLSDELSLCRRYMALEKLRLGRRLSTVWEVGDYGTGVMIPCLTLQPILENAIYHGIQMSEDGGEVKVSVQREKNRVSITVVNPLERATQQHQGNHMALQNTRHRLSAHFGADSSITTEATASHYMTQISYRVEDNGWQPDQDHDQGHDHDEEGGGQ